MKIYRLNSDTAWDFPYLYPEEERYPIQGYFPRLERWSLIEEIDRNPDRIDQFTHWTDSKIKPKHKPLFYKK